MFSICGYSNKFSIKSISDEDFLFVEEFVRNELLQRLLEKSQSMKIRFEENDKKHFFGEFAKHPIDFHFSQNERSLLMTAAKLFKEQNIELSPSKEKKIGDMSKSTNLWFSEENKSDTDQTKSSHPQNLLEKMNVIAKKNSLRPKQGYRYDDDYKRFCVYNRIMAGPTAFNLLHLNLDGCFPSVSTTNRYIHRSDHAIVEGELRVDELLSYLKDRKLPLWVSLSEDATRVENKVKYDSRTNQIIGFILPTSHHNGMPIPFHYKARSIQEIIGHFSKGIPVANFINTIMAQPLGGAPAFCLLIFGTNGQYTAQDVSKRWKYICNELEKAGIHVLTVSSDSDPRYNSAMRLNSDLGHSSNDSTLLFKCGTHPYPPFYTQDYYHILTKLRNLFLKSIEDAKNFQFGNFFVQQQHLEELLKICDKDKHGLTPSCLNPLDRQNVESAKRICDQQVINLLKRKVSGSEGTVQFLQIMSDVYLPFDDEKLELLDRVRKLWRSLFLVRIWRKFVLDSPGLTLKKNFMSSNCFYCIEQNAHSFVFILRYLRDEQLTHLFSPSMYSSQPCESFYRLLRSLTTISSTVVNFDTKGILDRTSRIHLLNQISNDKDSGFIYPKALNSFNFPIPNSESFPNDSEIINTIKQCKEEALILAIKIGLIRKTIKFKDPFCVCPVLPYEYKVSKPEKKKKHAFGDILDENSDAFDELYMKTITASLKNFASKVEADSIPETSSYVEILSNKSRLVFKKTSICWLLGKNSFKCSSDRVIRVRVNSNKNTKNNTKQAKKIKRINILRKLKSIKKIKAY